MRLKDDGKHIELITLMGASKTIPISDMKQVTPEELGYIYANQAAMKEMELFPVKIGEKNIVFYFDKKGRIENAEVFKAICNGYDIDLPMNKSTKEGDNDIIDI